VAEVDLESLVVLLMPAPAMPKMKRVASSNAVKISKPSYLLGFLIVIVFRRLAIYSLQAAIFTPVR
jgi:hypothetical protein